MGKTRKGGPGRTRLARIPLIGARGFEPPTSCAQGGSRDSIYKFGFTKPKAAYQLVQNHTHPISRALARKVNVGGGDFHPYFYLRPKGRKLSVVGRLLSAHTD